MPVYKAYFKIIKHYLPQLLIYIVVFTALSIAFAQSSSSNTDITFSETKVKVAFINYDNDSPITEGLKNYLNKTVNLIDLPDNKKTLQDALFFREVEYIIKIPQGFTESLYNEELVQIEKSTVPDSTSEIYMDILINKYLNTAKLYIKYIDDMSYEELINNIENDLDKKTEVIINEAVTEINKSDNRIFFFNYLAYALLVTLILGVSCVLLVYNKTDIKRRNLCAPISNRSMNFQLILGHLSYALLTWFVLILTSFIFYGSSMFTLKGLLFVLNSLLFTLVSLSISYLVGNVTNNQNVVSAATNIIALGSSFISGVMVPQAYLSDTVLKIASFTPTYWYVKSNNIIINLVNYNMDNLKPILINMLIIIGFTIAYITISLVVVKQKRMSK
ncbi:MAG TPA: ABC transporter permease [Haloplasmataceae bacterium]